MNVSFLIQGEGNGHLSQALKFKELLKKTKHNLTSVIVSGDRNLPNFFVDEIGCDIFRINSFQFSKSKNGNIKIFKTLFNNLINFKSIKKDLKYLDFLFKHTNTELVINFYEPIMGLYNVGNFTNIKTISVANQFIINHPDYKVRNNDIFGLLSFKILNYIVSFNSFIKLTFSIDELNDHKNIKIIPPFIKSDLFHKKILYKNFYLVYLMGDTNLNSVLDYANNNKDLKFEIFTDNLKPNTSNVTFNKLDKKKFNEKLLACSGIISSAGFQTLCESVYLKKPIYLIPIKNQFEQKCNAIFSNNNKLALNSYKNKISDLKNFKCEKNDQYIIWFQKLDSKILKILSNV